MNEKQLDEWRKGVECSKETEQMIQMIFDAGTTRKVQSRVGNVISYSPTPLNDSYVDTESRTVEFPYIKILEHDDDVIGFIEQPLPMDLRYPGKDGKTVHVNYTPDAFVFRKKAAGWIELKKEDDLKVLVQTNPGRYQKIDNKWRSIPAEEYAAKYGLIYEIVSDAQINFILVQNLDYLNSYYLFKDDLYIPTESIESVLRMVGAYPGITLKDLKEELPDVLADHINSMIIKKMIWVDLNTNLLIQPDKVKVYSSPKSAVVAASYQPLPEKALPDITKFIIEGMKISWLGVTYLIVRVYENTVLLETEDGKKDTLKLHEFHKFAKEDTIKLLAMPLFKGHSSQESFKDYSSDDWETAARRCKIVEKYLADGKIPEDFEKTAKTLMRWAEAYELSKQEHGDPIFGLLPQHHLKGCHKIRIPPERLEPLIELFKKHYMVPECPSKESAYALIVHDAKAVGVVPPSRRLFNNMIDDIGRYEVELARAGKRAAQKKKPFADDPNKYPAEGQWFLHRVHIDHTPLPIEILDPETNKAIGKPWATTLIDSGTRSIGGFYITMEKPSRKSVFMAIRDMVQRYGQLPEVLISDNGKEFLSHDYKCLAARYRMELQWRPPGEAQFGSPVERGQKTTQQIFTDILAGKTFPVEEARLRTGKLKPSDRAVWPLDKLKEQIEKYLFEDYDTMQHIGILMSPREAREISLKEHGSKQHRNIKIDDEFLFLTTPVIKTKRGYAKVIPGRGIKVSGAWYTCEDFRTPGVPGTKVQVRMDPSDPDRCYACVKGKFVLLKRHISNSTHKNMYKSKSVEVYNARLRATKQAYNNENLEIRGNMASQVKSCEADLIDKKNNAIKNQPVSSHKKIGLLKLVPKCVANDKEVTNE